MSNNDAFDEDNKKGCTVDKDADGAEIRMADDAVVEQQPQKPDEENMKADLIEFLSDIVKTFETLLRCHEAAKLAGWNVRKGLLLHGQPDLGPRVLKYLELHLKDITFVFPRDLLNLSPSKCDDTFDRAGCCEPSIVLLIGLEHADGDMEQMIARKIKENSERCAQVIVIGTTAMLSGVSEEFRKSFGVTDLQELASSG